MESTKNFRGRSVLLFGMIILVIAFMTGCDSCNKKKINTVQFGPAASKVQYDVFKLDSAKLVESQMAELLAYNTEDTTNILILKNEYDELTAAPETLRVKLHGYPARNHTEHGKNTQGFEIPKYDSTVTLSRKLIWGNVYVDWKAVRAKIIDPGTHNLVRGFLYLLFIPQEKTKNCIKCNGHFGYRVEAYALDASGTKQLIFPLPGSGVDDGKPSPPAPPMD